MTFRNLYNFLEKECDFNNDFVSIETVYQKTVKLNYSTLGGFQIILILIKFEVANNGKLLL